MTFEVIPLNIGKVPHLLYDSKKKKKDFDYAALLDVTGK